MKEMIGMNYLFVFGFDVDVALIFLAAGFLVCLDFAFAAGFFFEAGFLAGEEVLGRLARSSRMISS